MVCVPLSVEAELPWEGEMFTSLDKLMFPNRWDEKIVQTRNGSLAYVEILFPYASLSLLYSMDGKTLKSPL